MRLHFSSYSLIVIIFLAHDSQNNPRNANPTPPLIIKFPKYYISKRVNTVVTFSTTQQFTPRKPYRAGWVLAHGGLEL